MENISSSPAEKRIWRDIVDRLDRIILLVDEDYQIIHGNRKAADYFQTSPDELIGAVCYSLYNRKCPCEDCPLEGVLESGKEKGLLLTDEEWGVRQINCKPYKSGGTRAVLVEISSDLSSEIEDKLIIENRELREFHRRLNMALAGADASFWEYDFDQQFLYVQGDGLLGFAGSPISCSPQKMLQLIHPEDRKGCDFTNYLQEGREHFESNIRMATASGHWKWVHLQGKVVERNEAGSPAKAMGIIQDISEKKKLERRLEQEKNRLHKLFHNVGVGVSIYKAVEDGRDFVLVSMNNIGLEMDGYQKEEILNRSIYEIVPEGKESGFIKMVSKVYQTGLPQRYPPKRYKSPQGGYVWREGYLFKMPTGEIVTIYNDTTEQQKTRQELNLVRNRLEVIFENIDEAVIVFNKELKVIMANQAAGSDLVPDTYGLSLTDVVAKDKITVWEKALKSVINRKEEISLYTDVQTKDGQKFYQCRLIPETGMGGEVACVMCIARDITEYRQTWRALLKSKRQLEKNRLKTRFFSDLSHDFKTPLTLIISALQMLSHYREKGEQQLSQKLLDKYLGIIRQNSYRLLRLVGNLLDIIKVESDAFTLNLQNTEIVGLVREITYSTEEYIIAGGRELNFTSRVKEEWLACDPASIERIILNLLSNAIKFTSEGDLISVRINYAAEDKNELIISVADTGQGIEEEEQELIFKEYKQAKGSYKQGGTGLGLSIVKLLVEMHGGEISLESIPGEGSEFIITLPIKTLPEGEAEKLFNETGSLLDTEFSDIR